MAFFHAQKFQIMRDMEDSDEVMKRLLCFQRASLIGIPGCLLFSSEV